MPTLTVAGHSVTVGDEFTKLSPEEQNAAVEHIAASLPSEKGSGVVAGLAHGVAKHITDTQDTLKLFGGLDTGDGSTAAKIEPKNYKAAPIIREGGHWYNPSDYRPGNIPQALAEQAPGLAQDLATGMAVGKVNKWAGLGAGVGSTLLRTLGPMARENAKARTGQDDAEVSTTDKVRAALTGAVQAPINAVGLGRVLPGITAKVADVGAKGAANAAAKYLTTVGTEALTGGARDAVGQIGTTIGTDKGIQYDPNKTAEAAVTGAAGSGLLVAPKLAGNVHTAAKFREFGGANTEASTALANRQMQAADGKNLIGPLGGTKTAAEAVASAHKDVHTELAAASKGEVLSTENANTLQRIKDGGKANARELDALGTEATPEVVHLARQALLSSKLKSMGKFEDGSFNGGISSVMERLRPISNPVGTGVAMGATALAGHAGGLGMLGTFAPQVIAGILGSYGAARAFDKMTGARTPAKGFTDKFADGSPVRTPVVAEAVDPYNPSAGPWGPRVPEALMSGPSVSAPSMDPAVIPPSLRNTLNANAKIDEGIAKITKKLGDEKRKSLIGDAIPALQRLAATRQPPVTAEVPAQAPDISPIALKMLQTRLKAGLPPEPAPIVPEPAPAPVAPPVDAFDALKPLMGRQRAIMRGLSTASKQQIADNVAQRRAAGIAQAEGLAVDSHAINEQGGLSVLSNPDFTKRGAQLLSAASVMRRLTAEPPAEPTVPSGPTSPEIGSLMQRLQQRGSIPTQPEAPTPAPAAPQHPMAPAPAPITSMADILPNIPQPPMIAKIMKKANGKVKEEPHAEEFTKEHVPLTPEEMWGKGMRDRDFAEADAAKKTGLHDPEAYKDGIIRDREKRRGILADFADEGHGADQMHVAALLDELHHTRRAGSASSAVNHFTKKMSPKLGAAIRKRMDKSFINSMWKT